MSINESIGKRGVSVNEGVGERGYRWTKVSVNEDCHQKTPLLWASTFRSLSGSRPQALRRKMPRPVGAKSARERILLVGLSSPELQAFLRCLSSISTSIFRAGPQTQTTGDENNKSNILARRLFVQPFHRRYWR